MDDESEAVAAPRARYQDSELRRQRICATGVVGNSLEKSCTGTERTLPMHSLR